MTCQRGKSEKKEVRVDSSSFNFLVQSSSPPFFPATAHRESNLRTVQSRVLTHEKGQIWPLYVGRKIVVEPV